MKRGEVGIMWTRALLAVLLAVPFLAGCPKKAKHGEQATVGAEGGMDEGGLGGSGSSLTRGRRGQGPEEDGLLKDVHFGYDSDELDGEAQGVVSRNADWLRQNGGTKVELEGHCDSRGTPEYNLALGSRRANAVRDALVAAGVATSRITTISYGEELPLCQEETEACWARNRRVHGVVLGK